MNSASGDTASIAPAAPAPLARLSRHAARIASVLAKLALVVGVLTLARSIIGDQYHVPTPSMAPTIQPGDRIFVSKAAYGLRLPFTSEYVFDGSDPDVADVVIFDDPRGG